VYKKALIMNFRLTFFFSFFILSCLCYSQTIDTSKTLSEITITGYKTMNGIGRMKDYDGQIIYAGKKTEVILIDSLDANKAINNTRQILRLFHSDFFK